MKNVKRRGFLSGLSGSIASTFAFGNLFTSDRVNARLPECRLQ